MKYAHKSLSIALLGLLTAAFTATATVAQTASSLTQSPARAVIEGIVTKDPSGEPVKKAVLEVIAENQAEGGAYTAVTGADGTFRVEGIVPGRYRLFVERTGFLEVDKHRPRSEGRVLTLAAGQELKDVQIRLQAAAVVQGRVVDEDGDPLPSAEITVLRQTFASGRSHWEQVGAERTNDLGEYRVANLAAGNYYVSVNPPPDFKSLIDAANGAKNDGAAGAGGNERPTNSYQTTYYPGTTDRSQATPIQLHAGDDFPANFTLTPSPSLSIRGSVVGLPPHSTAVITLQSHDFNVVFSGAEVQKDGGFVLRDVSPGSYTILATVENAPVPMMAKQTLQIVNSVDGLRLAPQPGAWIHGRLRLESKGKADPGQMVLLLRPVDQDEFAGKFLLGDGVSDVSIVSSDGSFEWKNVSQGNYFVELAGQSSGNGEWYVKSVMAGGRDVNDSDISVNGGTIVLDMVVSANGGVVDGVAVNTKGDPVANAEIVVVPEARLRGREDRYRKAVSDQSGRFTLRAIPPGEYTVFAWESLDGEEYLNADFLKNYEGQGSALHISEGEHKSMQVAVIAESDDIAQ
jgi:protocatechuate 3,4-dioxygenase beta subunit